MFGRARGEECEKVMRGMAGTPFIKVPGARWAALMPTKLFRVQEGACPYHRRVGSSRCVRAALPHAFMLLRVPVKAR